MAEVIIFRLDEMRIDKEIYLRKGMEIDFHFDHFGNP
jgi:hypothetical protein